MRRISLFVSEEILEAFNLISAKRGIPRAEVMRYALWEYVKRELPETKGKEKAPEVKKGKEVKGR